MTDEYYDLRSDNPINQHDEPREQTQVEYLQELLNRSENIINDLTHAKNYMRGKLAKVALLCETGDLEAIKELTTQYHPF